MLESGHRCAAGFTLGLLFMAGGVAAQGYGTSRPSAPAAPMPPMARPAPAPSSVSSPAPAPGLALPPGTITVVETTPEGTLLSNGVFLPTVPLDPMRSFPPRRGTDRDRDHMFRGVGEVDDRRTAAGRGGDQRTLLPSDSEGRDCEDFATGAQGGPDVDRFAGRRGPRWLGTVGEPPRGPCRNALGDKDGPPSTRAGGRTDGRAQGQTVGRPTRSSGSLRTLGKRSKTTRRGIATIGRR